jgi:hypothetical protein
MPFDNAITPLLQMKEAKIGRQLTAGPAAGAAGLRGSAAHGKEVDQVALLVHVRTLGTRKCPSIKAIG